MLKFNSLRGTRKQQKKKPHPCVPLFTCALAPPPPVACPGDHLTSDIAQHPSPSLAPLLPRCTSFSFVFNRAIAKATEASNMKVVLVLLVTCGMAAATPGYLFIDAGSSGSKCTGLNSDLTKMEGKKVEPPLAQMDISNPQEYRHQLADMLKTEYALVTPGPFTPANKDAVPIQATAGMRLISQQANADIWDKICGKSGGAAPNTVTFATKESAKCGTIPGTTEGYFEWVAGGQSKKGSICSGGASLQIATPLYTDTGVEAFKVLVNKAKSVIDCAKLKLQLKPGQTQADTAPKFSKGGTCVDDYIKFHEKGSTVIKGCPAALCGEAGFKGLAVVSFLGLQGQGGFFYGGINEVSAVMEKDCKNLDFAGCKLKYNEELAKDKFFAAVSSWFKEDNRKVTSYKFGTAAANAHYTGLDEDEPVKKAASGHALERAVDNLCTKGKGKGEGNANGKGPLTPRPKVWQTCMKGWFTAHVATGLFTQQEAKEDENPKADIDWALGASKAQKSAFLETSEGVETMAQLEQLTSAVQKSMAGDFMKGAMIHYANLDTMANEHKMLRTQK